jgi:hypothetical protein
MRKDAEAAGWECTCKEHKAENRDKVAHPHYPTTTITSSLFAWPGTCKEHKANVQRRPCTLSYSYLITTLRLPLLVA